MIISNSSKQQLNWWIDNVLPSFKPISRELPIISLETESSKVGGGGGGHIKVIRQGKQVVTGHIVKNKTTSITWNCKQPSLLFSAFVQHYITATFSCSSIIP